MFHNHSSVKICIYMHCSENLYLYALHCKYALNLLINSIFTNFNCTCIFEHYSLSIKTPLSSLYRLQMFFWNSPSRGPCWLCHFSCLVRFGNGCLSWYKEFLFTQIKTSLLKVWNLFTLNFLPNNSSNYPLNDPAIT